MTSSQNLNTPSFYASTYHRPTDDHDEEHDWDFITASESREASQATTQPTPDHLPTAPSAISSWLPKNMKLTLTIRIGQRSYQRFFQRASTPQPTIHPQLQSPLFALPAELRLNIYALALSIPGGEAVLGAPPSKHHLALLQTCRRVLYEAEELYYAMHRFIYNISSDRRSLAALLAPLGSVRRNAIPALIIVTSSASAALTAIEELYRLPGLRELELRREMSVRYLNISEWSVLKHQMVAELAKLEKLR